MIPKKIHYCWFGGNEKTKLANKCIQSWKQYCPEYEIIEWNEENFDVNYNAYTRYCYDNKKWAFLSDFVRLIVVKRYGGIYFDTDVELVGKFDFLLSYEGFFAFEDEALVATGLGFGACPNNPFVISMIQEYENRYGGSVEFSLMSCPTLNTNALCPYGLRLNGSKQCIDNNLFLPKEYMNPFDNATGELKKTENTISIHWYAKSWLSATDILRSKITRPFHKVFGVNCFSWIKKILRRK